jgi:hypothetical protein
VGQEERDRQVAVYDLIASARRAGAIAERLERPGLEADLGKALWGLMAQVLQHLHDHLAYDLDLCAR